MVVMPNVIIKNLPASLWNLNSSTSCNKIFLTNCPLKVKYPVFRTKPKASFYFLLLLIMHSVPESKIFDCKIWD